MSTRQISWPRILAEGFAIVVSILLAFGIQAWWEGRQERREEQEIIAGLRTEFRGYEQDLLRYAGWYEVMRSDIEALLSLENGAPRPIPVALADSAFSSLTFGPTYQPGESTLDGLIASGRLELLRSKELRDALNLWRNSLDEVADNQNGAQDDIRENVRPYLARQGLPVARAYRSSRFLPPIATRPEMWPTLASDSAAAATYDRLRATPEFRALANVRLYGARSTAREVAEALQALREALRLLGE